MPNTQTTWPRPKRPTLSPRRRPLGARILALSLRQVARSPSRAAAYELEDMLGEAEDVGLIAPEAFHGGRTVRGRALERLRQTIAGLTPRGARAKHDHELLFVSCETPADLYNVDPVQLRNLRRSARVSACYVDELWAWTVPGRTGEMAMLAEFDLIFVGCAGSADSLASATGRPTRYLPPGVDALRFCPWPSPPPRCLDVHSLGRRSEATHAALLEECRRRGWFYVYSSLLARRVRDPREHRLLLASKLKRSRYVLVYPGKVDSPQETDGQEELGFRYFEGAAAGALLLGEAPKTPAAKQLFGWEDAVLRLPYGSSSPQPLLDELEAAPERRAQASARNVIHSLLRHDWVHRWAEVLSCAGLTPTRAMESRRRALRDRATLVAREVGQALPVLGA